MLGSKLPVTEPQLMYHTALSMEGNTKLLNSTIITTNNRRNEPLPWGQAGLSMVLGVALGGGKGRVKGGAE